MTRHETVAGQEIDPGPAAGEHVVLDFETGATPSGVTRIDGAAGTFGFAAGSIPGIAAEPGGDHSRYLYVSTGGSESFLFDAPVRSVSFYWGSVDNYNAVDILGGESEAPVVLETLTGGAIFGSNLRHFVSSVRLYISAADAAEITGLRFRSSSNSFEIDDVAIGASGRGLSGGRGQAPVPEPGAWAGMLLGLFGLGAALRAARQSRRMTRACEMLRREGI
jgi:hypothetical protein